MGELWELTGGVEREAFAFWCCSLDRETPETAACGSVTTGRSAISSVRVSELMPQLMQLRTWGFKSVTQRPQMRTTECGAKFIAGQNTVLGGVHTRPPVRREPALQVNIEFAMFLLKMRTQIVDQICGPCKDQEVKS